MSDRDDVVREAARSWWRYAKDDLAAAEQLSQADDPVFHLICFTSQQAVEKAFKTALVLCQVDFPHTHELELLQELVPDDWAMHDATADVGWLTTWAVAGRYPGNLPDAQQSDAERARTCARDLLAVAHADLEREGLVG